MSIDSSPFHDVFVEESFEGIDVMVSGLFKLDVDTINSDRLLCAEARG